MTRRGSVRAGVLAGALTVVAMAVAVGFTMVAQGDATNPHGESSGCAACHSGEKPPDLEPPVAAEAAPPWPTYPLQGPDQSTMCRSCHPVDGSWVHPVDSVPRFPLPAGFPLDAAGRLVCSSCHDPHRAAGGALAASTGLLRGNASGAAFCSSCHSSIGQGDIRAWHVLVAESAHGAEMREGAMAWGPVDRVSAGCLGCHDGTAASNVARSGSIDPFSLTLNDSHPIGMDYRDSVGQRRLGRTGTNLRDAALLDERIRLFDGKVGCGSCHNPYSDRSFFLVMERAGGELCMSCHDM